MPKRSEQDELLDRAEAESDADQGEDDFIPLDLSDYEAQTFGVAPAGEYLAEVVEVKMLKVKSGDNAGKPQLRLRLALREPKNGKPVFKYAGLYPSQAGYTKGFLKQFGVDVSGKINKADIIGRVAYVKLSIREQEGRNDDNEIQNVRPVPPDEAPDLG